MTLLDRGSGLSVGPFDVSVSDYDVPTSPGAEVDAYLADVLAFVDDFPDAGTVPLLQEIRADVEDLRATFAEVAADPGEDSQQYLSDVAAMLKASQLLQQFRQQSSHCYTEEDLDRLESQLKFFAVFATMGCAARYSLGSKPFEACIERSAKYPETFQKNFVDNPDFGPNACDEMEDPPPSPPPTPTPIPVPAITGMGSIPPGGPAYGNIPPADGPSFNSRGSLSPQALEPGRIVVKIFSPGIPGAFTGVTDRGGFLFIPTMPAGQPFTAVAIDTVTREQRSFEGVGPASDESIALFFDFITPGGGGGPIEISFDSNTSGNLLPGEGIDQFSFQGSAGQEVNVALLAGPTSLLDATTAVELFAPSGGSLARRAIPGSRRYAETDVITLPETGTYFIEVSSSRSGDYLLGLPLIKPPTPITIGPPEEIFSGAITILGDHQRYSFDGTAMDFHKVKLEHPGGSELEATVRVDGSGPTACCAVAATLFNERTASTFPFPLTEDGSYLVEVHSSGVLDTFASRTGDYQVTIFDPEPMLFTVDTETTDGFAAHEFDLFSFDGATDELLNLALLASTPDLRFIARVYGQQFPGSFVASAQALITGSNIAPFGDSGVFALEETGTHFIAVYAREGDAGDYRIGLPGIDAPTPVALTPPSTSLDGDLGLLGERHFFSVDGAENDLFELLLGHPAGSQLNATVRLREPSQFVPGPPFYQLAELASATTTGADRAVTKHFPWLSLT